MMKMPRLINTLVISLMLSLPFIGKTQIPDVFPVSGAEWGCRYHTTDPWNPFYSDVYFKTEYDTLLDGVQYTFVQDYASVPRLIRVEGSKVYAKFMSACCESAEFLLYDFSLNAGDSTTVYGYGGEPIPYPAYVESVDSLFIGGTYHKRLHITSNFQPFDFVQGIGALQGVFYCDLPMTDWWCDLTCFSINGTAYALDGTGDTWEVSCWETIDNKPAAMSQLKIYPNPVHDFLRIECSDFVKARILTIQGKLIKENNSPLINISDLAPGIYLVEIENGNGNKENRKILKY